MPQKWIMLFTEIRDYNYYSSYSHPLTPSSPFAFKLSQHQGLFQWVSSSHQVTKVLVLQLQHQSFQWIFRVDFLYVWLVLAVQGTLRSLLQHHSSEASVLWCSAFFMVQLLHPYMTTGKTIALTMETLLTKWVPGIQQKCLIHLQQMSEFVSSIQRNLLKARDYNLHLLWTPQEVCILWIYLG